MKREEIMIKNSINSSKLQTIIASIMIVVFTSAFLLSCGQKELSEYPTDSSVTESANESTKDGVSSSLDSTPYIPLPTPTEPSLEMTPLLETINDNISFQTDTFTLELNDKGVPDSLKLNNGQNILNKMSSKGFRLNVPGKGTVELTRLSKSGKNTVFSSEDGNFSLFVNINATPNYIAFTIERFKGELPVNSTLNFTMSGNSSIEVFVFDYATTNRSHLNKINVVFERIWERHPSNSLGGFAIYHYNSSEEQDDRILHVWGAERVPRPKVSEEWNYERAKKWMDDWVELFKDQSVMYIEPKNMSELEKFQPYLDMADVKQVYLFTNVWQNGGFWPTNNLNWQVGPGGIFGNEENIRKYSLEQKARGQLTTIHWVSGGIGQGDPIYAGQNLSDQLACWVDGTLAKDLDRNDVVLYFKPSEDTYVMPDDLTTYNKVIGSLSKRLQSFWKYNYLQIGDELIRITGFIMQSDGTWRISLSARGDKSTIRSEHLAGSEVKGILMAYDQVYVPDINSSLLEEVAMNYASMLNRNEIYNVTFDGIELHSYEGNWGSNKFAQLVYEHLDHPVITHTSWGRVPDAGYIEYQLNRGKALNRGPKGDHNHGRTSLTLERTDTTYGESVPASNLLAANFQLSTQAAYNGENFSILRPDPMFGITLNEFEAYGRTKELLKLLPKWKDVSKKLTDQQRQRMLNTHNISTGRLASETTFELRETSIEYQLVPMQMMSLNPESISGKLKDNPHLQRFHMKQEAGMYAPKVDAKFGEVLSLENKYEAQAPQFILRILKGSETVQNPSIRVGSGTLTMDAEITLHNAYSQYIEYRGGNTAILYDHNWNKTGELSVSTSGTYRAETGYNDVVFGSTNKATALIELILLTEGSAIIVKK